MQRLSDQRALYIGKYSVVMDSRCRLSLNLACTAYAHCNAVWSDLNVPFMRCDHAPAIKVLCPPTSSPLSPPYTLRLLTGGAHNALVPVHRSLGPLC